MMAARDRSQAQGELLEWLSDHGYVITLWRGQVGSVFGDGELKPSGFYPVYRSIEGWLAEVHDIDLDKIETEKRTMLERQRALNEAT